MSIALPKVSYHISIISFDRSVAKEFIQTVTLILAIFFQGMIKLPTGTKEHRESSLDPRVTMNWPEKILSETNFKANSHITTRAVIPPRINTKKISAECDPNQIQWSLNHQSCFKRVAIQILYHTISQRKCKSLLHLLIHFQVLEEERSCMTSIPNSTNKTV